MADWPNGKASVSGAGDSGFETLVGRTFWSLKRAATFMCGTPRCILVVYIAIFQEIHLSINASLGEGVVHLLLLLPGIVLHTASAALGTLLIRSGRLEKVVDLTCDHGHQQLPA